MKMIAVTYVDNSWNDLNFLPPDSGSPIFKQIGDQQPHNDTNEYLNHYDPGNPKSENGGNGNNNLNININADNFMSDFANRNNMTGDTIFNFSINVAYDLIMKHSETRILFPETEVILIVVYTLLMVSGVVSNLLVCFVVMRQCARRKMDLGASGPKSRNLYIVNLAVADLALCCICMPFTLVSILRHGWTFGSLLCKLVPVVQGTNIMVSAGTITAIAFDRYITIVRSPRSRHTQNRACCNVVVTIITIWVLSFAVTSPLFFYTVIETVSVENFLLFEKCLERWPSELLHWTFNIALALFQFVIPVLVLTVIHLKISAYLKLHLKPINKSKPKIQIHSPIDVKDEDNKIKEDNNEEEENKDSSKKELLNINKRKESVCSENSAKSYESVRKNSDCSRKYSESSRKTSDCSETKRNSCDISPRKRSDFLTSFRETSDFSGFSFSRFSEKSKSNKNHKRARRELRRNRRTMFMLSCIAAVYAISWLPMTIFEITSTLFPQYNKNPHTVLLIFAACHIVAMSTAITNPLLYGWLNTNFRREFTLIFSSVSNFFSKIFKRKFNATLNINNNNKSHAINNNINMEKNSLTNHFVEDKVFMQPGNQNNAQYIGQQTSGDRRISLTYITESSMYSHLSFPASTYFQPFLFPCSGYESADAKERDLIIKKISVRQNRTRPSP